MSTGGRWPSAWLGLMIVFVLALGGSFPTPAQPRTSGQPQRSASTGVAVSGKNWVLVDQQVSPHNGHILVLDNPNTGIRSLIAQSRTNTMAHSLLDLRNPVRLVSSYTQIIALITSLHPAPLSAYNIGLGGSTLPRFHLNRYPASHVDSVDIDNVMIAIAKKHFQAEQPNHTIIAGDGAAVLKNQQQQYQVVWIDASTPDMPLPDVFLTDDFLSTLKARMSSQNLVVLNLSISSSEKLHETVRKYKKAYRNGILVKIPRAANQILAVGDDLPLTCSSFFSAYQAWMKQKIITVRWTSPPPSRFADICSDLD